MTSNKKTFDAVAWTRSVRDQRLAERGERSPAEYLRHLSERGKHSQLWKRLAKRHRQPKTEETTS